MGDKSAEYVNEVLSGVAANRIQLKLTEKQVGEHLFKQADSIVRNPNENQKLEQNSIIENRQVALARIRQGLPHSEPTLKADHFSTNETDLLREDPDNLKYLHALAEDEHAWNRNRSYESGQDLSSLVHTNSGIIEAKKITDFAREVADVVGENDTISKVKRFFSGRDQGLQTLKEYSLLGELQNELGQDKVSRFNNKLNIVMVDNPKKQKWEEFCKKKFGPEENPLRIL
jgi:hypothetical protein